MAVWHRSTFRLLVITDAETESGKENKTEFYAIFDSIDLLSVLLCKPPCD